MFVSGEGKGRSTYGWLLSWWLHCYGANGAGILRLYLAFSFFCLGGGAAAGIGSVSFHHLQTTTMYLGQGKEEKVVKRADNSEKRGDCTGTYIHTYVTWLGSTEN
ncbi:hypothetical protein QBC34DRAFT_391210 [Podospora aff. communis PSN243]|uniref:Uncharacterized protein n=1 Tax=Podospora aff. communis PSN243 TaxID=3040156 RepID=A0AAV9H2Z3_9PEZI|nr:hypothetical protein QBC34DRAFT_391210 [Podospora aff. communis PSN243]